MGSVGWVESGGVIYNHLSNPNGELAAYYEIETLDNCGGHSDQSNQYHYHLVHATFLIIHIYVEVLNQINEIISHRSHTVMEMPTLHQPVRSLGLCWMVSQFMAGAIMMLVLSSHLVIHKRLAPLATLRMIMSLAPLAVTLMKPMATLSLMAHMDMF